MPRAKKEKLEDTHSWVDDSDKNATDSLREAMKDDIANHSVVNKNYKKEAAKPTAKVVNEAVVATYSELEQKVATLTDSIQQMHQINNMNAVKLKAGLQKEQLETLKVFLECVILAKKVAKQRNESFVIADDLVPYGLVELKSDAK